MVWISIVLVAFIAAIFWAVS